jgi:signal peptidase II
MAHALPNRFGGDLSDGPGQQSLGGAATKVARRHRDQRHFDFSYAENPGIAFGQLQEGGAFGRWFFVVLAAAAAIAVLVYFFRTPRSDDRILGACALLLAGIAGNLTDRARLGFVIDFIQLHAGQYHWPTFNLADASISFGALLLAYDLIFAQKKEKQERLTKEGVPS